MLNSGRQLQYIPHIHSLLEIVEYIAHENKYVQLVDDATVFWINDIAEFDSFEEVKTSTIICASDRQTTFTMVEYVFTLLARAIGYGLAKRVSLYRVASELPIAIEKITYYYMTRKDQDDIARIVDAFIISSSHEEVVWEDYDISNEVDN